jgi:hypothetical protein
MAAEIVTMGVPFAPAWISDRDDAFAARSSVSSRTASEVSYFGEPFAILPATIHRTTTPLRSTTTASRTPSSSGLPIVSRAARAVAAFVFGGLLSRPVRTGLAALRMTAWVVRSSRVPMAAATAVLSRSARRRSAACWPSSSE